MEKEKNIVIEIKLLRLIHDNKYTYKAIKKKFKFRTNMIKDIVNNIKELQKKGDLIFEGEYLNGLRNGKGKEYWNTKLIFEGEYLYDYRLKGKYYINERLEYEGDYLYNKKYNGKGYDANGNIIYELKNGTGKVKEYYDDGELKFEGEYSNGKRNGQGKEYYIWSYELKFEGEYLNGERTLQNEI